MNNTKNSLNRKSNVLRIEIKLDEARGGESKAKRAELQKTELKEQMLDRKAGEILQTSQKQVKEAAQTKSKNNENKNQETDNISKNCRR
ncbi:MAG: hypothetical protein QHH06_12550 [Clostridiales bacterium]|nr:hypothetical protein [Eubacteriales bacterium]MDH7567280.1 hypothetical protein [Clostridiales bacterium]